MNNSILYCIKIYGIILRQRWVLNSYQYVRHMFSWFSISFVYIQRAAFSEFKYDLFFVSVMMPCLFIAALWSIAWKRLTSWLSCMCCFLVICHFPMWCLGQVWYLIPDLCIPPYFERMILFSYIGISWLKCCNVTGT